MICHFNHHERASDTTEQAQKKYWVQLTINNNFFLEVGIEFFSDTN